VSGAAAAQAAAWCEYLAAHARRLYAAVTDAARVAAALLATRLARGRLASPFTAREVYRQEWTGLTEPRVVQGALECLEERRSGISLEILPLPSRRGGPASSSESARLRPTRYGHLVL
jgi:RES domain-containing protein